MSEAAEEKRHGGARTGAIAWECQWFPAAFLPEAQQAYDAVRPVCKQVICVSSDEIGWFHNETKLEA